MRQKGCVRSLGGHGERWWSSRFGSSAGVCVCVCECRLCRSVSKGRKKNGEAGKTREKNMDVTSPSRNMTSTKVGPTTPS